MAEQPRLKIAIADYGHTRALKFGNVSVNGIQADFIPEGIYRKFLPAWTSAAFPVSANRARLAALVTYALQQKWSCHGLTPEQVFVQIDP